jgi:hypothetical protein
VPLARGTSDQTRSKNIAEMIRAGHPQDQAIAASYRQQRESKKTRSKKRGGGDAQMARGKGRHGRKHGRKMR